MKRLAALILAIIGLGVCLYSLIPSLQANSTSDDGVVEEGKRFACQVLVEKATLKPGDEQNIVVYAQNNRGEAMEQVSGILDLEFPSGQHQKTYLPATGEDGFSSVKFTILEDYFDGEIGRVIVRVNLRALSMQCETETTFLVWY